MKTKYVNRELSVFLYAIVKIFELACLVSVYLYRTKYDKKNKTLVGMSINSYGDTLVAFDYARYLSIQKKQELFAIVHGQSPDVNIARIFCKAENVEIFNQGLLTILIFFFPKYKQMFLYMIYEGLKIRFGVSSVYAPYCAKDDPKVSLFINSELQEGYITRRSMDNFFYGQEQYFSIKQKFFQSLDIGMLDDSILSKLGLMGKQYVVLHMRYLKDQRDPRVITYFDPYPKLIKYLNSEGYIVVLMGLKECVYNLDMIDKGSFVNYSESGLQSVENDFVLVRNSALMIGCSSGPSFLTNLFNKNLLTINMMGLISMPSHKEQRFLHKNIYKNSRKLTLNEYIESPVYYFDTDEHFQKYGYRYEDNSEDEILEATRQILMLVEKSIEWEDYTPNQLAFRQKVGPQHMALFISQGMPVDINLTSSSM